MEVIQQESRPGPEPVAQGSPRPPPDGGGGDGTTPVVPDLGFIRELTRHGAGTFKKCMQCGTCSAVCALSPDGRPFPRKEMAWAAWGLKARLLEDLDVWLCYQCNDCSVHCPRGARPGDLLGAVRRQVILHHAAPRFLARWVNRPGLVPIMLAVPAVLLGLALLAKEPIREALGLSAGPGQGIVYSYSSAFPHGLLNGFFLLFGGLALLAAAVGVARFWRALSAANPPEGAAGPARGSGASIAAALLSILRHDSFPECTTARTRLVSHACVLFGFLALTVVTTWVITAGINPLLRGGFVYPFSFWSPWKMLANAGGLAVVAGCLLMIRDRLRDDDRVGSGTFFDWALLATLLGVTLTGFLTELLHYARLEPHRHVVYFIHLVLVFALLIYLPYSKLAHLLYRATALIFAERTGRVRTNGIESGRGVPG